MARTWKDHPYDFVASKNNRAHRKAEKKRMKEQRKAKKAAEQKTFAEEPFEEESR